MAGPNGLKFCVKGLKKTEIFFQIFFYKNILFKFFHGQRRALQLVLIKTEFLVQKVSCLKYENLFCCKKSLHKP